MSIFTKSLNIQVNDAGHCETLIRSVHAKYPQCRYTDVLNACIDMCNRHPEPSRVTLGYLSFELADRFRRVRFHATHSSSKKLSVKGREKSMQRPQIKSLKEVLDAAKPPVWRDEKTGRPMHRHGVDCVNVKGKQDFYMPDPSPCDCGREAFDIPLSAVQPKQPTKGDH